MADSASHEKKKKKKHKPFIDWLAYVALRILMLVLYMFDVETILQAAVDRSVEAIPRLWW